MILTVFLFGVRGFASGFFQAIYLYTPEVTELYITRQKNLVDKFILQMDRV